MYHLLLNVRSKKGGFVMKTLKVTLLLILLFFVSDLITQPPIEWIKTLNFSGYTNGF
jgi:hypothetical protein